MAEELELLPSAKPAKKPNPVRDLAKELTDAWWESRTPRPAQPYIAALKVVETCVRNGWARRDIEYCLQHSPVVSGGAFDLTMSKRQTSAAGNLDQALSDYDARGGW